MGNCPGTFFEARLCNISGVKKQSTQGFFPDKGVGLTLGEISQQISIIDKYTFCGSLFSVYKTYTINKNSTNMAEAVTTSRVFYFAF